MKELLDVIAAWRKLPPGSKTVLATVVATSGSTYRKPGARMLVTEAAWVAGSISGGCLEGDVLKTAWERTAKGPVLVTYDSTSSDDIVWGFGLGCRGTITVLFERLEADSELFPFLADCVKSRNPGAVATVVSEGSDLGCRELIDSHSLPASDIGIRAAAFIGSGRHRMETVGNLTVFFESVMPPTALTIFGAGHDVLPLVSAAKGLGWYVSVIDHRAAMADPARLPEADRVLHAAPDAWPALEAGSVVVVMTHNYLTDRALLGRLITMNLSYLGQLGPRVRTDQMLAELAKDGIVPSEEARSTLHAPVGLDLGGSSPEEVALSIIAEIQLALQNRSGVSLTRHAGPIHTIEDGACPSSR